MDIWLQRFIILLNIKETLQKKYLYLRKRERKQQVQRLTHLWFSVLVLGALQDMMNYSTSGGIGEEGLSVVDSEALEENNNTSL